MANELRVANGMGDGPFPRPSLLAVRDVPLIIHRGSVYRFDLFWPGGNPRSHVLELEAAESEETLFARRLLACFKDHCHHRLRCRVVVSAENKEKRIVRPGGNSTAALDHGIETGLVDNQRATLCFQTYTALPLRHV